MDSKFWIEVARVVIEGLSLVLAATVAIRKGIRSAIQNELRPLEERVGRIEERVFGKRRAARHGLHIVDPDAS